MEQIRFVDLFAGTGAFTHVLKNYGATCVFSNDMVKDSEEIYNLNHQEHALTCKDLNTIEVDDIPEHDILCGGFPCQPFSIAGERRGFQDTRSNVFWKILAILERHRPKVIILENVKNLKTHDNGNTYTTIITKLEELGYCIEAKVLDTSKITDVPQHRERIYIVGFIERNKQEQFSLDFPKVENKPIIQFLEESVPEKYYYTDRFKVYQTVIEGVINHVRLGSVYQLRRHYVRENKSKCCPTLTANMGSGGHNVPIILDDNGVRKLTPRECFSLQGFPEDYQLPDISDSSLYKLAGNAVSVPVVKLIIQRLHNIL